MEVKNTPGHFLNSSSGYIALKMPEDIWLKKEKLLIPKLLSLMLLFI